MMLEEMACYMQALTKFQQYLKETKEKGLTPTEIVEMVQATEGPWIPKNLTVAAYIEHFEMNIAEFQTYLQATTTPARS